MARKPTPAGATPADTTPPAAATAPAAAPAAPAPAEAPAAPAPADAGAPDTSAAVSETPPAAAAADAAGETTGGAPSDTPAADPDTAPASNDHRDPLEVGDARVLIAFDEHLPDDILSGTLAELRVLERDGKVDTHPDAVAYVRSLQA